MDVVTTITLENHIMDYNERKVKTDFPFSKSGINDFIFNYVIKRLALEIIRGKNIVIKSDDIEQNPYDIPLTLYHEKEEYRLSIKVTGEEKNKNLFSI